MRKRYNVELVYMYDWCSLGCHTVNKEFDTLDEAKEYIEKNKTYNDYKTEFGNKWSKTITTKYYLDHYIITEVIEEKEHLYYEPYQSPKFIEIENKPNKINQS